jgi:ribosome biogenesis GTPase
MNSNPNHIIGRVAKQHKDRYAVLIPLGDISECRPNIRIHDAEITGNLRFSANSKADFPVVGDWVEMSEFDDFFIIHRIVPRSSLLQRQAVQTTAEVQPIASNIDVSFIMQAVDRDFNLNRLDRYVSITYAGKIEPVILLNKLDLITKEELAAKMKTAQERFPQIQIFPISVNKNIGVNELKKALEPDKTYCLIGSSGVGKSSLLNLLLEKAQMETGEISDWHHKGKHTTTHRELTVLTNKSVFIDTPGMRELGLVDEGGGLESTFERIYLLAEDCRFADCQHENEPGCVVRRAIKDGELDRSLMKSFRKLNREAAKFSASKAERRKKDRELGKFYKRTLEAKRKFKG